MPNTPIVSTLIWNTIPITISYVPVWSELYDNRVVSHIEVRADEPIPITETGYKSIFFYQEPNDVLSSVIDIVHEHIIDASLSKEWKALEQQRLQPSLF